MFLFLILFSLILPSTQILFRFLGYMKFDINVLINKIFPLSYPFNTMLSYFIIGGVLKKKIYKFKNIKFIYLIIGLILGCILLQIDWYISSVAINNSIEGVYVPYNTISVMMMSISTYIIIAKVSEKLVLQQKINNIVRTISENTIIIYYLNWIVGYTFLLNIVNKINDYGLFTNFFKVFIQVIILAYVGKILKKINFFNFIL